jgi:phage terminase large subunit
VQSLYDSYVGEFARQELEGEFVGYEGLVYPEFNYERHVVQRVPAQFAQVIAGVDWGFTNPGVIQVLGITGDSDAYLIHEEYARNRGIDDWANIAVQLRDMFKIEAFYCDPSEPDYIRKFNDLGARAYNANNTVSTGIQNVKRRLAGGKLKLYSGAAYTRKELESYEWLKNGDTMIDKPKKANDHTMDALRYAVMQIDNGRKPISVSVRKGLG